MSAASHPDTTAIYVIRRKWHIDIGFAAGDLRAPLNILGAEFPQAKYIFFGFGDRHYLLSQHRNPPELSGALLPGAGLVLMTAIDGLPQAAFGASEVIEFRISSMESAAAQNFIWRTVGDAAPYAAGPYEGSLYFSAVRRYSALHTCNTWAAEVLRSAGLPVRLRGVVFAGQLWSSALNLSAAYAAASLPR